MDSVGEDGSYVCYEVPAASMEHSQEPFDRMQEAEADALYRPNNLRPYDPKFHVKERRK